MLASMTGPVRADVLTTAQLQWQYDMSADPTTQDLDSDTNADWQATFTPAPSGGVLPMSAPDVLQMNLTGPTSLWNTADGIGITSDYTVEFAIKTVGATEGTQGRMVVTADPHDSAYDASWLGVGATGQHWGPGAEAIGDPVDNSDAFHTYRITRRGGAFWAWRDGVGLRRADGSGTLPNVATGSNWNLDRLKVGQGNSAYVGDYEIDYIHIDRFDAAPAPPDTIGEGVWYTYDFEDDANPVLQDLDENNFGYFRDWHDGGDPTIAGGVATMSTATDDVYESGYQDSDNLWITGDVSGSFTAEMSVKILTQSAGKVGAMGMNANPNGASAENAWLNVAADGQSWGTTGAIDLGSNDNTDGFHQFRVVYEEGTGFFVWRDDVLLNPGGQPLASALTNATLNRLKIGDLSTAGHGGTFEVDYMSFAKGAIPIPEPGTLALLVGLVLLLAARRRTR
jgi:hypothetical protein